MFDPPQRMKFFRLVMIDALDWWRFTYLARRIEAQTVRKAPFNYRLGVDPPMYWTGKLLSVITKGRIRVSKPRGNDGFLPFVAKLSLPFGHPVPPQLSKVFRVGSGGMLPDEVRAFANRLQRNITDEANGVKRVNRKEKATGIKRPRFEIDKSQKDRLKQPKVRGFDISGARSQLGRRS